MKKILENTVFFIIFHQIRILFYFKFIAYAPDGLKLPCVRRGVRGVIFDFFTDSSDIDWSQPVSAIDQQLYKKYGLDKKEIAFIEKNVKEMA